MRYLSSSLPPSHRDAKRGEGPPAGSGRDGWGEAAPPERRAGQSEPGDEQRPAGGFRDARRERWRRGRWRRGRWRKRLILIPQVNLSAAGSDAERRAAAKRLVVAVENGPIAGRKHASDIEVELVEANVVGGTQVDKRQILMRSKLNCVGISRLRLLLPARRRRTPGAAFGRHPHQRWRPPRDDTICTGHRAGAGRGP